MRALIWQVATLCALSPALTAAAQEVARPVAVQEAPRPADGQGGIEARLMWARQQLDEGLALTASREVARLLSTIPAPSPDLIVFAARAHAAAGAWPVVRRLLLDAPWLDSVAGGAGRLWRGRAYLEMDSLPAAERDLETYLRAAPKGEDRREAQVALARALASRGSHGAAARTFEAASGEAPEVADWLRLSALQQYARDGDTSSATRLAATLTRSDVVSADSVRLERARSAFQAADTALGLARARALRPSVAAPLEAEWIGPALVAAGDTSGAIRAFRNAVKQGLAERRVRDLLLALDEGWQTTQIVAAAELKAGNARRAVELFSIASQRAPPVQRPGLALEAAEAELAAGRYRAVEEVVRPWLVSPAVSPAQRAALWYAVGRARLRRGDEPGAIRAFGRSAEGPMGSVAAYASYRIADLAQDRGDAEESASAYRRTIARFPRSRYAGQALMRLGFLAYLKRDFQTALNRFRSYRRRFPSGSWSQAAMYWSARAHADLGEPGAARALYEQVVGQDPLSYYGVRAAARTGRTLAQTVQVTSLSQGSELPSRYRDLIGRMDILRSFGWAGRARWELRKARMGRTESISARVALATALDSSGWPREGAGTAWSARRRSESLWSAPLLRAIYPLLFTRAIGEAAAREGLDPALVAALVRRESGYDRGIESSAGAVGLMQLLPRTAEDLAREIGVTEFRADRLQVAELNLALGSRYLRRLLDRSDGSVVAALISYNAGPHRLTRWRAYPEFSAEIELQIERIPFAETRRYVKAVLAYAEVYGWLYPALLGRPIVPQGAAGVTR